MKEDYKSDLPLIDGREDLELFRKFAEASGEGFGMSEFDGRIVYVNPALCRMFGEQSPGDVIGKNVTAYYSEDYARRRETEMIPALLQAGRWQAEPVLAPRNGEPIRTMQNTFVIRDEEGNPMRIAVVIRDVTETRRAEEGLVQSEQRLHSICDSVLDALVLIDASGKAVYWNPAAERMFGRTAAEMLGERVHDVLLPKHFQEQAAAGFAHFGQTGQGPVVGKVLELTALHKDGTEFPIEISAAAFRMDGRWCAAGIVRDISQRKCAEAELREKNRNLEFLMASSDLDRKLIAYEIHDGLAQQLIGAIMQFQALGVALQGELPERAARLFDAGMAMLRASHEETRRLIAGVRSPILDESGVVEAIRNLVVESRRKKGPRIKFRSNVRFHRLAAILEDALYRICQEALTNACRYSNSRRVRVSLRQIGNHVRVSVRDWGLGFDTAAISDGHFGLQGIRQRAGLLGGTCTIRSAPGKGTRVAVELPLIERDEKETPVPD